jgi:hypothetical protein
MQVIESFLSCHLVIRDTFLDTGIVHPLFPKEIRNDLEEFRVHYGSALAKIFPSQYMCHVIHLLLRYLYLQSLCEIVEQVLWGHEN